jgi:hypothetical protein
VAEHPVEVGASVGPTAAVRTIRTAIVDQKPSARVRAVLVVVPIPQVPNGKEKVYGSIP